ncbi:MAG: TetR/AcrR family transcriptional regulator [Alphaproteobacteria bacterium]|jgi:AcrR family transcriptional regulator|nr:TetR/AcrR family transcriptional regulator [Alphaproteobacteria bacterium]
MATEAVLERAPRQDNRKRALMDAAATAFAAQGYRATTIRDVAGAVGMLPGSVYYHFPSKGALLLAVYDEAVTGIAVRVDAAIAGKSDPWARLEAAAVAHMETVLDDSAYAKVMVRVLPEDAEDAAAALTAARDSYEARFRDLFAALDLPPGASPASLRLMLLGALNGAQVWYRPGGETPAAIARSFVRSLKTGVAP